MKNLTILLTVALLTTVTASAETLFAPDFSTGSTPSGYTATTSNGGTITYSNDTMTVGDLGSTDSSPQNAYITATSAAPGTSTIESKFTFTLNYTAPVDGNNNNEDGNQSNTTLFTLNTTAGANNPLVQLTFQTLGYNDQYAAINLYEGIAFGGGTPSSSNTSSYHSPVVNSLDGDTFTVDLVTTFSSSGGNATDSTVGTLSDSSGVLYNYNYTTTGSNNGGGFDPVNNPVQLILGDQFAGNNGIITSGSIDFSDVNVSTVTTPEPSTYALLLGGLGALALIARRKLVA